MQEEQPSAGRVAAEEESCAATRRTTPSLLPVKLVAGHLPPLGLVAMLHLSSSSSATAQSQTSLGKLRACARRGVNRRYYMRFVVKSHYIIVLCGCEAVDFRP